MYAEDLIKAYPSLSVEDANYYELQTQFSEGEIWFRCTNEWCKCDPRPFMVTYDQFKDAEGVIECDICSGLCKQTFAPDWVRK